MRTIVYVDGFNLYYGCLKNSNFKWLNLIKLFENVLQNNHAIVKIKYFTARIKATPNDPSAPQRQQTYIRAMETHVPEVEILFGHFLRNKVRMANANPPPNTVEVYKTEEKGSDVNLAVHLLNDAWLDNYECAVVVSNDSDMAESMRLVRSYHPNKVIGLVTPSTNPANRTSQQLKKHAHFTRTIRKGALAASQLPDPIPNTAIFKPINW